MCIRLCISAGEQMCIRDRVLSELPKEAHEAPMLSLDKTKEVPVLQEWLGSQKGLLSWKLDGLTIVLTYEGGELVKACLLYTSTSCRTVESATGEDGILKAGSGWTEIFIYPGYRFKILDCLITNFHLPESTLVRCV